MGAEISSEMASNGAGDSADSVRIYTTDTIVDHPGAEIVYKGLITVRGWGMNRHNPFLLTEEAKARAKKLDANAIVGMKITDSKGEYTFIGTAVRYFK